MGNIYDIDQVKRSAVNWISVFRWAGIPEQCLTGNHGPCPKCGGSDRFRLLDQDDGSLHCNQCFREKNGDGIAALQWWWGLSLPETLDRLAEHLGVEPAKTTKKKNAKADPAAKLQFIDWVDTFAQMYCRANPGIHAMALQAAGAKMAYYYDQHTVIALPIYGQGLLAAGPVGWIAQDIGGSKLPRFDKSGKVVEWVKRKITYGSRPGVVGDRAARELASGDIRKILKVEGVSDYLAAETCLLAEPRRDLVPITLANGAGEDWRKHPWLIELLKDRELWIVHDCDQPGQQGADAIINATAKTCTAKNYVLPYPVKKTHGEDFRDWIASGVQNPIATLEAAFSQIQAAEPQAEIYFGADNDPHVLASKFLAETRHQKKNTIRYWREDWYQWTGKKYHAIRNDEFRSRLTVAIKRYADEAFAKKQATGSEDQYPFKVTRNLVSDTMAAMAGECQIPNSVSMGSMYENGTWVKQDYLALDNGILDIQAHAAEKDHYILPHTPDWFSVVNLGYRFDPDCQCNRWTSFLSRNLEGDMQRISLVQEWAGYLLTPETGHQKFMILEGEGANGKSVFLATMTAMLGLDNVSTLPLELFGQQFALTNTLGKLANISADCGEIDKLAEGHLKAFTGGDNMQFERKYKDAITDKPTARLMIGTNNRPRFSDKTDGIWRRMILIPWRIQIPVEERIHGMDSVRYWQDLGELPGILQWALLGLRRLRRQGRFTESDLCNTSREAYKAENNPAREFLMDNFRADQYGFIPTMEIYKKYTEWCQANGYKSMGNRMFGREVNRVFPHSERTRRKISSTCQTWGYLGISENPDFDNQEIKFD